MSHNLTSVRLTFINIRPSFTIIRFRPHSAQYREPIYFWCQGREGSQYNYERLQISALNPVLGKVLKKMCLLCSNVVASLRRALLVDALFETSWLDKPPHSVKVGLIEGHWTVILQCLPSHTHYKTWICEKKLFTK